MAAPTSVQAATAIKIAKPSFQNFQGWVLYSNIPLSIVDIIAQTIRIYIVKSSKASITKAQKVLGSLAAKILDPY